MTILTRLERKFGRFALSGPVNYLIAAQVVLYVWNLFATQMGNRDIHEVVALVPAFVQMGEVWRLLTFLIEPPRSELIFAFFYWYVIYMFANSLEYQWGSFRLNVYLVVGWAATVAVAMLVPSLRFSFIPNGYLYTSLFLAFALLYPEYELYIAFLLPVKVKWLALLTLLGMGYFIYEGSWPAFWMSLAALANYLLFFGYDFWHTARHWWRGQRFKHSLRVSQAARSAFFHECRVCGLTSQMSPQTQFRYCSKCDDQACYCPEHLANHEHVVSSSRENAGAANENA